jgi:uncharacterized protein YydD (DUF2326 family)
MIHRISADRPSFHTVELGPGLNVIVADRTRTSSQKDTRNGLGKTSLLEVIHFCLGAKVDGKSPMHAPALADWTFTLALDAGGELLEVSRNTSKPGTVKVASGEHVRTLKLADWNLELGERMLGLSPTASAADFAPSFRSLISYVIRRGAHACTHPFMHHHKQFEWDQQVHVAYLLGLAWEDAAAFQVLREKKKLLDSLRRAAKSGLMGEAFGTEGEMEADRVRLQSAVDSLRAQLGSFQVNPQYRELEEESSRLTAQIHALSNLNVTDRSLLRSYQAALAQEQAPASDEVARLYQAATVELPDTVKRKLGDLQRFHTEIVENRRRFLSEDVTALETRLAEREREIADRSARRAERLEILRTHGALDEYHLLQQRLTGVDESLREVTSRLASLRSFVQGSSALKQEAQALEVRARHDYDDRRSLRELAIRQFDAASRALYDAPGRLVIDVTSSGFKFSVEIERSGAQGIESMKVFCFDLVLAQLLAGRSARPGFLIHDTPVFDPVDSRQRAHAIQLAAAEAEKHGFQYLCTFNSDQVPVGEFERGFAFESFVRLTLTDATPAGGLFGMRF